MKNVDRLDSFSEKLQGSELFAIAKITSCAVFALQQYAHRAGFVQLMPILLSPFTDPLNHAVYPAMIEYEGRPLKLTASMIFHKQMALAMKGADKIFIVSPNIRLEKAAVKSSANHLIEFSQFDFELKDASAQDAMSFIDGLVKHAVAAVKTSCAEELRLLNRELPEYAAPFAIHASEDLQEKYGDNFESALSKNVQAPFFVTNYKREFYDRETPGAPGHYNNFDLIYPDGFGEGLSGAEREFDYDQIVRRMKELDMNLEPFESYLEMARRKLIPQTAGGGLGIQRFIKFLCGKREIKDVCIFDRSIQSAFVF